MMGTEKSGTDDFEASMSELGTLAFKLCGGNVSNMVVLLAATAASVTAMPPEAAGDGHADLFVRAYREALPLVRPPRVMRTAPAMGRA